MHSIPRVFISYARKDGEVFTDLLIKRLEHDEPEITIWQDHNNLEGGVGWWRQIEEALKSVKFLVIIVTPAACQSEITRKEWQYARQRGVNVYPVLAVETNNIDFQSLPSWMRKSHFFNLEKEWNTFINYLKSDRQPPRVPFMAPDLPSGYVPRKEEFNRLLNTVLYSNSGKPEALICALHGSGGYGKTTMAIALCHDERIITIFDDGILWITLGQHPHILKDLTKCYEAVTGIQPDFLDLQQAAVKLAEILENRNCLLVIDDVWRKSDVDPFLLGGKGCVRLITTREFGIAIHTHAARIDIKEMNAQEAKDLLIRRLPKQFDELGPLRQLTRRLGNWPLLINLASGVLANRIERGDTLANSLGYLNLALDKRGVTAFDEEDDEGRSASVKDTLEISLALLESSLRESLAELAIFPEDTEIPLGVLAQLWHIDIFDVDDRARRLADHALLELDLGKGLIRQHDEIRTYLGREVRDIESVHARLIKAWGNPLLLPNLYAWNYFAYHLEKSGQLNELRELLFNFHWIKTKFTATNINALLQDCEYFTTDSSVQLLASAFRLSSDVICESPEQFAAQLYGRLKAGQSKELDFLIEKGKTVLDVKPLRPVTQNFLPAGSPLLYRLSWNSASVFEVFELANGRLLSCFAENALRIWSTSGTMLGELSGHSDTIIGAMKLSGNRLLTWSKDGTLRIWSIEGVVIAVLTGHCGAILGVRQISGDRIVSWSQDNTIRLWSTGGVPLFVLIGHEARISGVWELSADRLVSFSEDKNLRLWRHCGDNVTSLTAFEDGIKDIVEVSDHQFITLTDHRNHWLWSIDGDELLCEKRDDIDFEGALKLSSSRILSWGRELSLHSKDFFAPTTLLVHEDRVLGAIELSDGRLLSWSQDKTLRLWSGEGETLSVLYGHDADVGGAIELTSGRILTWGCYPDLSLRLWSKTGELLALLIGHEQELIGALELSDSRLVSWSLDKTIRIWSLEGQVIQTDSEPGRMIWAVTALSDKRVLTSSSDNALRLWTADGSLLKILAGQHTTDALELSDGRILSYGRRGLTFWSISGEIVRELKSDDNDYKFAMELSDHRLITLGYSGITILSSDGDLLGMLMCSDCICNALELSDGSLLSWSYNHSLSIWPKNVGAMAWHKDIGAWDIRLSDGRFLSWSKEKELKLWSPSRVLLGLLIGHNDSVISAFELSDGRFLSWSEDKTLRLWSADGSSIGVLLGHNDSVISAFELSDGRLLSCSEDKTLRLWSADGSSIGVLLGHNDRVTSALELSDGRLLSWSEDKTLRLWSRDGYPLRELLGHEGSIRNITILSDGRLLSCSSDRTLRLWSNEGTILHVLSGHEDEVWSVFELKNGSLLSVSFDSTLRLWSPNGSSLGVVKGYGSLSLGVCNLLDGSVVLTGYKAYLDTPQGEFRSLSGHEAFVFGTLELSDGRLLSWSADKTLRLWSPDGNELRVLSGHELSVIGALQLSDGRILSWSMDKTIRMWLPDGSDLGVFAQYDKLIEGMAELNNGKLLIWLIANFQTLRWTRDGKLEDKIDEHYSDYSYESAIERVVTSGVHSKFCLLLHSLDWKKGHEDDVIGALELSDGRIVSWSKDKSLRLWSQDGTPQIKLEGHAAEVQGVLELSDGRLLSWAEDNKLRIWSTDGVCLSVLVGHSNNIYSVHEYTGIVGSLEGKVDSKSWGRTFELLPIDKGICDESSIDTNENSHVEQILHGTYLTFSDKLLKAWLCIWTKQDYVMKGHTDLIRGALELSDHRLLSWSRDATLRIWSPEGMPLEVFTGHEGDITGAIELKNGSILSWSKDRSLRIWSKNRELSGTLLGHEDIVYGALELTDGRLLSWSEDMTLRIWSQWGSELKVLYGHKKKINGVFSLLDGRLLSWSHDRTVRLWSNSGDAIDELYFDTGVMFVKNIIGTDLYCVVDVLKRLHVFGISGSYT